MDLSRGIVGWEGQQDPQNPKSVRHATVRNSGLINLQELRAFFEVGSFGSYQYRDIDQVWQYGIHRCCFRKHYI